MEQLPTPTLSQPIIESTVTEVSSDDHSVVCPTGEKNKGNVEGDQHQSISSVSGDQPINTRRISLQKLDNNPESSNMNGMNLIDSEQNGNEDNDEEEDMDSSTSEISDFSDFSQESWHPVHGPIAWVQEQMRQGQSARSILEDLVPPGTEIPDDIDPIMMWRLIINIVSEPPKRKKLESINTLEDVISLMKSCSKIIVLTGAGVSVSCGIPDFRSRDGVYARLAVDFPNLPNPQAMFDITFFRNDPRPFFKFAKEIYPGQFKPSLCHHFIRLIESQGKLLRNYTQNIDTLEQEAGIERVVQCHGSFATATCTNCKLKVKSDVVREDIFKQVIPKCPQCPEGTENAIMKPDIVFFGESLPEDFHKQMAQDKDECDLLIVIGSSLKVKPVALIPNSVPAHVPQILINRERLHYLNFDVELLGNCDNIIAELCHRLGTGWDQMAPPDVSQLTEVVISSLPTPPISPRSPHPATSSSPSISAECREKMVVDVKNNSELCGTSESSSTSTIATSTQSALVEVKKTAEEPNDSDIVDCEESVNEPVSCADCTSSDSKEELQAVARASVHCDRGDGVGSVTNPTSSSLVESVSSSNLPPASRASLVKTEKEEKSTAGTNLTDQVSTTTSTGAKTLHHSVADNDRVNPRQEEEQDHSKDNIESNIVSSTSNEHSKIHHHKLHHNHSSHHHHHHNHKHSHHHHHNHQNHHRHGHHHQQHSGSSSSKSSNLEHRNNGHSSDSMEPSEKRPRLETEGETSSKTADNVEDNELTSAESEIPGGQYEELDDDLEEMRKMWQGRKNRVSLAQRLADDQYLFLPPNRYVFKGAEVFSDSEEEVEVDSNDDEARENNEENSNNTSGEAEEEQEELQQVVEIEETPVSIGDLAGSNVESWVDGSTPSSSSSKPSVPAVAEDVDEKDRVGDVSSTNNDNNEK